MMKRTWRVLVLAMACCLAVAMTTSIALAKEDPAAEGTGYTQDDPQAGDPADTTDPANPTDPQAGDPTDPADPTEPTDPVDPVVKNGLVQNEDGTYSYYIEDVAQTGQFTVEEQTYLADENGILFSGVQTIEDVRYFFDETDFHMVKGGWAQSADGTRYYAKAAGALVTKTMKTISGKKYYFNAESKLVVSKKFKYKKKFYIANARGVIRTGWITFEKNRYYANKKGQCLTGWQVVKKGKKVGAYYFKKKTGIMASNEKVKYLKVPKSGNVGMAYVHGIRVLNKRGWSLWEAYKYSYKLKYAHRWMRKKTSEDYANYGFTHGQGNCYVMAGTFYVMAKLLGYNVHQMRGYVVVPHSWTEIVQNGKTYVYDPNFRNETGRSGWKIYYGKKGTWRYTGYSRMN